MQIIRDKQLSTLTYRIDATTQGHCVEFWYDRISKNWIVQYKDAFGYQVGAADIVYTRAEAQEAAEAMSREVRH